MPDSEVNIRKVKVMAGRGLELKDDDYHVAPEAPAKEALAADTTFQNGQTESAPANPAPSPATIPAPPTMHYLVAAAVIENDSNAQPYEDDILKLVVTLPVEGQTQNVQFDFHLVQDDAIQVAKEMVAELGIPQGAVLEISETISGLARAARVSQDKYLARQKAQGQGHLGSTQMSSVSSLPAMASNSDMGQNMAQQPPSQGMVPSKSHQSMHEQHQVVPNHSQTSHVPQLLQPQGMQVQEQSVPMGHSQHAPMPSVSIQPHHAHMQPLEMTKQNSDVSSQSFGQQSRPIAAQQQPPSHMNPVNTGQQAEGHLNHHVASADTNSSQPNYGQPTNHHVGVAPGLAAPSADTNSSQPNYGQQIPVPSQTHQAPGVSTQSDPSSYFQSQQVPNSSQPGVRQTPGVSSQSDPSAYAQSQQVPTSSQPAPQPSGHHAPGMHVMQQQQSGSAVAPQNGIVQAPHAQSPYVPPQGNQVQGYTTGITSQTPTHPPAPQHPQHVPFQPSPMQQQPGSVQQSQAARPTQQFVSAAGPAGSVERTVPSSSPQDDLASMSNLMGAETTSTLPSIHQMNETHPLPVMERLHAPSESDQMDEELAVELRKLDDEFKKTVSRAKKVFDSRMDTISRLQHEREALHQKTLSEHEKQRIEFERRLQQEEIEQNRRIEQLQKDWARKREEMKLVQGDPDTLELESLEPQISNHDATDHVPIPNAPEGHSEEG